MRALCLGTLLIALCALLALLDGESGLGIWHELRVDVEAGGQRRGLARLAHAVDFACCAVASKQAAAAIEGLDQRGEIRQRVLVWRTLHFGVASRAGARR